jgi:hypothetical protein
MSFANDSGAGVNSYPTKVILLFCSVHLHFDSFTSRPHYFMIYMALAIVYYALDYSQINTISSA